MFSPHINFTHLSLLSSSMEPWDGMGWGGRSKTCFITIHTMNMLEHFWCNLIYMGDKMYNPKAP